jgi:hypothetical protein
MTTASRNIDRIQDMKDFDGVPSDGSTLIYSGGRYRPATTVQAKTYIHYQNVPSVTWDINHNLAKRPSVTIVDSAGTEVIGGVNYVDDNNLILDFSAAFSGKAYLN